MKPTIFNIISIISILLTGLFILYLGTNPILYSLETEKPDTLYHSNIQAVERISINSSQDMIPIMQDILDYSGPVALNIRMQDLNAASADLEQYYKQYRNFDKLVINLEMDESELQEFQENTKLQESLFRELMNTSESLDTLKRLEFRYRDQKDVTLLKSVAYQGESLKKKIQGIREKYNIVNSDIIKQGKIYDLNTSKVEQAREDINRFVDEIAHEQEIRKEKNMVYLYQEPKKSISLLVSPETGIYRDPIRYSGFISGSDISQKNISIFLDNIPYFYIKTDEIGHFSNYKQIDEIRSGTHELTARWDTLVSDPQYLTAIPINTTIDLFINAVKDEPIIILNGLLMANKEVTNAPVYTIINNASWNVTKTDNNGNYRTNITLPDGTYLVYTLFNASSYPLFSNQSQTYEVISSGGKITSIRLLNDENPFFWIIIIGSSFLVLMAVLFGYYFYWFERKDPLDTLSGTMFHTDDSSSSPVEKDTETEYLSSEEKSLLPHFHIIEQDFGLSEAARQLYLLFLNRILQDIPIERAHSFTIREIAKKIKNMPYNKAFICFACMYEKIRYGGVQNEKGRISLEKRTEELDKAMKRKNDE